MVARSKAGFKSRGFGYTDFSTTITVESVEVSGSEASVTFKELTEEHVPGIRGRLAARQHHAFNAWGRFADVHRRVAGTGLWSSRAGQLFAAPAKLDTWSQSGVAAAPLPRLDCCPAEGGDGNHDDDFHQGINGFSWWP